MATRDWRRFIIISIVALFAMTVISATLTDALDVPAAYGLSISAAGLAVVLFSWHVYVQTSPGGIDTDAYLARPLQDRLIDFALVIVSSGLVATAGVLIGIEAGLVDPDVLWGEDMGTWLGATLVLVIGMLAGIYAGIARNKEIRITESDDRGE